MQVTTTSNSSAHTQKATGSFRLAFSSPDSQEKPRTAAPEKGTKGQSGRGDLAEHPSRSLQPHDDPRVTDSAHALR